MAKRMDFSVVGLPHYTVWHLYEPSVDDIRHMEEMEQERKNREREEKERAERMKKIKEDFDMPSTQWDKDKADIEGITQKDEEAKKQIEQRPAKEVVKESPAGNDAKEDEKKGIEDKPVQEQATDSEKSASIEDRKDSVKSGPKDKEEKSKVVEKPKAQGKTEKVTKDTSRGQDSKEAEGKTTGESQGRRENNDGSTANKIRGSNGDKSDIRESKANTEADGTSEVRKGQNLKDGAASVKESRAHMDDNES